MALIESAVVVYLRELYYASGFVFPLTPMKPVVILTELAREFATIVMLWTIAFVAGRNFSLRFAWFIIGFGIWDIFYYVFLFVFIQWPVTLVDWDILFLIPLPWYGPVIAPVLISVSMIIFGMMILYLNKLNVNIKSKLLPNILLLLGCAIALHTFMFDFWNSINFVKGISTSDQIMLHSQVYIPIDYNYGLFGIGMGLIGVGIWRFWKDNLNYHST
jgi:hypothetical protein